MHARLSSRIYARYLQESKKSLVGAIKGPDSDHARARRIDSLGLMTPIDKTVLAQQLTLYESRLYLRITPRACLNWPTKAREATASISAFSATSDKLSDWVKFTILNESDPFLRGDVIDHWIEIAEVCPYSSHFVKRLIDGV